MIEYDIRDVKLITGEEFVAKVATQDSGYLIKNPICFMIMKREDGVKEFSPREYMAFAEKNAEYHIKKEHVVCMVDPHPKVKDLYKKLLGK